MFCSNCGNQIPDGARFCDHCGSSVGSPAPIPQYTAFAPTAPTPVAAPATAPVPVQKKKKKMLLPLICILALVVVAVVVVAAVLLFGKQTVYLVTETVNENMNSATVTSRYEYDEDGRITKFEYEYEYPESYEYSYDMKYEITYEYDEKGNLKSAEFESDGDSLEVEYVYNDSVLEGFEITDSDDALGETELDVECDDEGRFEYIAFLDQDGNEYYVWEFEYHDNGIIKESFQNIEDAGYEILSRYNEDGNIIESSVHWNDELMHKNIYDYDENGRQTLIETYDENDELLSRTETEYTFEKDQLIGLTMKVTAQDSDGEQIEAEIVFQCEWDGLECELIIDEINGDEETLGQIGFSDEDIEIMFEKDEYGNLVKMEMSMNGEVVSKTTYEYEEYKVSRNYQQINVRTDPLYLYFLMNS